jgi:hypothetical protein
MSVPERQSADREAATKMVNQLCDVLAAMRGTKAGWYGKISITGSVADGSVDMSRVFTADVEETRKIRNGH